MISAGLDVGSRTIAFVLMESGKVRESAVVDTGVKPMDRCFKLLNGKKYEHLTVTGYGRHLVARTLGGDAISEIGAYAAGARRLYPDCGTVIDIGGQDSKVIVLSADGSVQKFEMNDRCAAGTGKFLEVMAATLETDIDAFGGLALKSAKQVQINSLCTVFAESEVVSLIGRGEDAAAIAMALHQSVAARVAGMVRRVGVREKVIFAGGGSRNRCLQKLLAEKLEKRVYVPEEPQLVGALGAALLACAK
jgi:predicted CoA-substrate-specific enzyme activase